MVCSLCELFFDTLYVACHTRAAHDEDDFQRDTDKREERWERERKSNSSKVCWSLKTLKNFTKKCIIIELGIEVVKC